MPPNTVLPMNPFEIYYLNQAGRCLTPGGDRPCICSPALLTAGPRNKKFFWQSASVGPTHTLARAKAVFHETLRTGGKILTDIAENKSPELGPKYIFKIPD